MKKIILYACILLAGLSSACRKNQIVENQENLPSLKNKSSLVNPNLVTQMHNLNLIYFVPNDLDTLAGYRKRLSDLMLWGQNWYKDEMQRNGYGPKTFGLLPDTATGGVKIILIRGALPKSSYPYSGGSGAVASEINAYFAAHPTEKTSEHSLIIIPRYSFQTNGTPSGGPFYGSGKWCYALDYEGMDIQNMGKTDAAGNLFTTWFGGMIHELGHGLNLPHNSQKVSENATLGMALMNAGNYTLSKSPTFLTATDAAILNVNQIFNNDNKTYYGSVTAGINKIHASYSPTNSSITVSGKYTTSVKVNSIVYYNDPNVNNEGTGVNHDYNAITWESKSIGLDSFYVVMPISDLQYKSDGMAYELKVKLVHENGNVTETIYTYTFAGGVPVLTFSSQNELSKTGWTIASFSSEETSGEGTVNGRASKLIDGNASTYWHSRWSSPATSYPHNVVIDLGSLKTANGLSLTQRSGLSRSVKNFEVLTSTDGINFTSVNNYVAANTNGAQYFSFGSPKSLRYFKIIANSAYDGLQFAALAELGLY
ncbi:discoidin domain-containing protein [Pedobacter miscanthi]|uniref:discoidin domain-containing protein n=1 Tax=Pedobacter miscanthi TaxID=2259170 RepID=UPI00292D170E|nr:discoidin domain-containing protein [Pedobacter miscanthi]